MAVLFQLFYKLLTLGWFRRRRSFFTIGYLAPMGIRLAAKGISYLLSYAVVGITNGFTTSRIGAWGFLLILSPVSRRLEGATRSCLSVAATKLTHLQFACTMFKVSVTCFSKIFLVCFLYFTFGFPGVHSAGLKRHFYSHWLWTAGRELKMWARFHVRLLNLGRSGDKALNFKGSYRFFSFEQVVISTLMHVLAGLCVPLRATTELENPLNPPLSCSMLIKLFSFRLCDGHTYIHTLGCCVINVGIIIGGHRFGSPLFPMPLAPSKPPPSPTPTLL